MKYFVMRQYLQKRADVLGVKVRQYVMEDSTVENTWWERRVQYVCELLRNVAIFTKDSISTHLSYPGEDYECTASVSQLIKLKYGI